MAHSLNLSCSFSSVIFVPLARLIQYNTVSNDIVESMANTALNGKLYVKLLISLEGQALQNMIFRIHLRANGQLLLQELTQTYHKLKNVPEVFCC
jgi:hypothetical protein